MWAEGLLYERRYDNDECGPGRPFYNHILEWVVKNLF